MKDNDAYIEYVQKMRKLRQFQFFGITPEWHPGQKDIDGFVHDEVVRQFHDTRVKEDGGVRVGHMRAAWDYALEHAAEVPTIEDVRYLGYRVEPKYNINGDFRHENVYIGDRLGVYPPFLTETMQLLMTRAGEVLPGEAHKGVGFVRWLQVESFSEQVESITSVDEWYLAYEWIHPWRDGNGRSGKILHNWLGGTLNDPVLVPDYFGGGNP